MADDKMLHTKAEVLREGIKVEEGVVDAVVGSTNVLDRMGDIIDQDGWEIDTYTKTNPVILWGHNVKEERPPIGKALKVWLEGKQARTKKLMFKVKFDLQDSFAAEIFRKIKDGFVNTVSVGFLPTEWEELDKDLGPFGGRKYTKQELLELSFVPVPANPEAVVALRSMNDKRFAPVELKDLYPEEKDEVIEEEVTDDEVQKPYENEHACRLRSPGDFQDNSFRSMKRSHKGKPYRVIIGKLKGETTTTEQAYRYGKDVWDAGEARTHCKAHGGTFEGARAQEDIEVKENIPAEPLASAKPVEEKPVAEETPVAPEVKPVPTEEVVEEKEAKDGETKEEMLEEAADAKEPEEPKTEPAIEVVEDEPTEETPTVEEEPKVEEEKEEIIEEETKGVISFSDHGTAPETEGWDAAGEMAKTTSPSDWKKICTWFDSSSPDNKGSYKLPHHKGNGEFKAVWRGVAAAMAALLGARGGVQIPDSDKKGVYNHLKRHYAQFSKPAPDFRMVEEQVLAKLDEELLVLALEREEKYQVRLIKKVLRKQNETKVGYTSEQIKNALSLINLALSLYKKS